MISITKLLTDNENYGDSLRYTHNASKAKNGTSEGTGPVVVWNITKTCNLNCVHCYARSDMCNYDNELTHEEACKFIDDLSDFNVPVLLFSGGEPLLRKDFFELALYAKTKGIRPTLSTNGTLIDVNTAKKLKELNIGYVGISLDGLKKTNDEFRGVNGAFDKAIQGIRNCINIGQRVGLRFTITKNNVDDVNAIFDLLEEENIDRVCFYHLVYSGRGSRMIENDISYAKSRNVMDLIISRTLDFQNRGINKEILMVDNHADSIYTYLKVKETDEKKAERILELISANGGNRCGMAFGNVDSLGNIHPDQFSQHITFGNVKEERFGDVWVNGKHPILQGLKDRKPLLKGRCSTCKWLAMCNGNFRARAEAIYGDYWESDPACYLTDDEIKGNI